MQYPSLLEYIEIALNLRRRLRTLPEMKALRDEAGGPIYRTKGSVAYFAMRDKEGADVTLGFFLNVSARNRYTAPTNSRLCPAELLIAAPGNNVPVYCDVILQTPLEKLPRSAYARPEVPNNSDEVTIAEGVEIFCAEGLYGMRDMNGQVLLAPDWEELYAPTEGRSPAMREGLWGLVSNHGEVIIQPEYDDLTWDNSRFAYVENMGLWGVIDRTGRTIIEPAWTWTGEFSAGHLLVMDADERYGYLREDGTTAIEPQFDNATSFNEFGYTQVTKDEATYFIDTRNKRV